MTEVLVEEKLPIAHEYYCAVLVDRSTRQPVVLFTEAGGVEIEETARTDPDKIRRVQVPALMTALPAFAVRDLVGNGAEGARARGEPRSTRPSSRRTRSSPRSTRSSSSRTAGPSRPTRR